MHWYSRKKTKNTKNKIHIDEWNGWDGWMDKEILCTSYVKVKMNQYKQEHTHQKYKKK